MTPSRVGKQLVPHGVMIGHHVPAVGFAATALILINTSLP